MQKKDPNNTKLKIPTNQNKEKIIEIEDYNFKFVDIMDIKDLLELYKFYDKKEYDFVALMVLRKIVKIEPTEYRKFNLADQLRRCGFRSESLNIFKSINKRKIPKDYKKFFYIYSGQLYLDMGNLNLAKKSFMKSIDLGNKTTVPYIYLASISLKKGNVSESIIYLQEASKLEGDKDEVYYNLATRLAIAGDIELAIQTMNKCIKIDPQYPNAVKFIEDWKECLKLKKSLT